MCCLHISFFFFFNDTATTEIYTLSLHDALPICRAFRKRRMWPTIDLAGAGIDCGVVFTIGLVRNRLIDVDTRSEEHTSELQSQSNLVCRLLLEKKKKIAHLSTEHATLRHTPPTL